MEVTKLAQRVQAAKKKLFLSVPDEEEDQRFLLRHLLGEPVTLFGESYQQRKARLTELLVEKNLTSTELFTFLEQQKTKEGGKSTTPAKTSMAPPVPNYTNAIYAHTSRVLTESCAKASTTRLITAYQAYKFDLHTTTSSYRKLRWKAERSHWKAITQQGNELLASCPRCMRCTPESLQGMSQTHRSQFIVGTTQGEVYCYDASSLELILPAYHNTTSRIQNELIASLGKSEAIHQGRILSVNFSPHIYTSVHQDGTSLTPGILTATASEDSTAQVWRNHRDRIAVLDHCPFFQNPTAQSVTQKIHVRYVGFHPSSPSHLVTTTSSGAWGLWDLNRLEGNRTSSSLVQPTTPVFVQRGPPVAILCADFQADGTLLCCGDTSGQVLLWDLRTGQVAASLPRVHQQRVISLAAQSPGGVDLATGGDDSAIALWDLRQIKEVKTFFTSHTNLVMDLRFGHSNPLPETKRTAPCLVSASFDGTLKIWDYRHPSLATTQSIPETSEEPETSLLETLRGHESKVYACDFVYDFNRSTGGGGGLELSCEYYQCSLRSLVREMGSHKRFADQPVHTKRFHSRKLLF